MNEYKAHEQLFPVNYTLEEIQFYKLKLITKIEETEQIKKSQILIIQDQIYNAPA